VEEGITSLTEFMEGCDIPRSDQDRFLSSYLMRNLAANARGIDRSADGSVHRPLVPDAAEELPLHLNLELTLHSRAKALRTRGIKQASVDFSFGLVESLEHTITLLPGDYLVKAGNKASSRVYMVDRGVLEIFEDGISKGCLYPGDVIGKGWLGSRPMETQEEIGHNAFVDWRSPDGLAIADIRAMSECRLVMGLQKKSEVIQLQRQFPQDIDRLRIELRPKILAASGRWERRRQQQFLLKRAVSLPPLEGDPTARAPQQTPVGTHD
jgi:hypothetical protein